MTDKTITIPVLVGEKEEVYNIQLLPEQYEQIVNGSMLSDSPNPSKKYSEYYGSHSLYFFKIFKLLFVDF